MVTSRKNFILAGIFTVLAILNIVAVRIPLYPSTYPLWAGIVVPVVLGVAIGTFGARGRNALVQERRSREIAEIEEDQA